MKKIILVGYMGSGKSTIARLLANQLEITAFDLDVIIENENQTSIKELFATKGEVFFRKLESETLNHFLQRDESFVLSLGGGTPCYGNNMLLVNAEGNTSVYLKASVSELHARLRTEKENRPLIALQSDEELQEFIAKHVFERNVFYTQAKHIVTVDGKSPETIVQEIKNLLV